MQITPIQMQQVSTSRCTRAGGDTGVGRRYRLEGDARPGDVLALAGGALVYDRNENGIVDGFDARWRRRTEPPGTAGCSPSSTPHPRRRTTLPSGAGALLDVPG
jgi:hypothetical protein